MQEWIVMGVVIANMSALIYVVRSYAVERKDMLDRLMSRDLVEYKEAVAPLPPVSGPVSLTDEDEWAREVEMMNRARGG